MAVVVVVVARTVEMILLKVLITVHADSRRGVKLRQQQAPPNAIGYQRT